MSSASKIQSLFQAYFDDYGRHDAGGCAALFANDAQLYTSFGPPLVGVLAIRDAHSEWFEEDEQNKAWALEYERVDGSTCACLISFSSEIPAPGGDFKQQTGQSLAVLERGASGRWAIRMMSMTLDAAA